MSSTETINATLSADHDLPDYGHPPAFETRMALNFAPLPLGLPHFGLLWADIRDAYPRVEVHPPAGEFTLQFEVKEPEARVNIPVQCWFINSAGDRLLQVQNNSFSQTWRRTESAAAYLHYRDLRPIFDTEWKRLKQFMHRESLGNPNVLYGEVSYVNHLEKGVGWNSYSDISAIFPSIGELRGKKFLAKPEVAVINASYVMPSNDGRLQISITPAVRRSDGKEIIQLTLTAKCRPANSSDEELSACLDMGRRWVVKGFDDITHENMHRLWGKKKR